MQVARSEDRGENKKDRKKTKICAFFLCYFDEQRPRREPAAVASLKTGMCQHLRPFHLRLSSGTSSADVILHEQLDF